MRFCPPTISFNGHRSIKQCANSYSRTEQPARKRVRVRQTATCDLLILSFARLRKFEDAISQDCEPVKLNRPS